MAYVDVRFPTDISFGSSGGPEFMTEIIALNSGHERRNAAFPFGRHRYNAAYGAKTQSQIETLIKFFHSMRGMGDTFRWKDPIDWKTCDNDATPTFTDQVIGTGDGSTTVFQLVKNYSNGVTSRSRHITRPINGTVTVGINGVQNIGGWSLDYETGIITFTVAPTSGHSITWGGEFDVHVRFDTDYLPITYNTRSGQYDLVVNADVPVVEVRV